VPPHCAPTIHALMQSGSVEAGHRRAPHRHPRQARRVAGVNLVVQGAIEDVGRIVPSIEEARDVLRAWR